MKKPSKRFVAVLALGGLLLLSGGLQVLLTDQGRAFLQGRLLLSEQRVICVDGLAISLNKGWILESLPDRRNWTSYLLGLTPTVGSQDQGSSEWTVQIRRQDADQRLVISRSAEVLDWPQLVRNCSGNDSCQKGGSPFFGDSQTALRIQAGDQIWYQHEYRGLLVAVHHADISGGSSSSMPKLGACKPAL